MKHIKILNEGYRDGISLLTKTFEFIRIHFPTLLALGFIAAFGRVLQLGGFGEISSALNGVLEVVIQSSRIFLFVFVLGESNVQKGWDQVIRFISQKSSRRQQLQSAVRNLKQNKSIIIISLTGYGLLAFLMNYLIEASAYQTCFLLHLKNSNILDSTASEWSMLLFLKNISVIPFTIIFETILILWISGTRVLPDKQAG